MDSQIKTAAAHNASQLASQGTALQSNAQLVGSSANTAVFGLKKHVQPYISTKFQVDRKPITVLWAECFECGKARAIASGLLVKTISTSQWVSALIRWGWKAAPHIVCDGCIKYNRKEK